MVREAVEAVEEACGHVDEGRPRRVLVAVPEAWWTERHRRSGRLLKAECRLFLNL